MSTDTALPIDTLPAWGEWLDDRHLAVRCLACSTVYTGYYWSQYGKGGMLGGVPRKCAVCEDRRKDDARKALPLNAGLVAAVKAYALDHYDDDGWDFVVESYTDTEIWEVIAGSKTERQAIRKLRGVADLLNERRQDVQATAWQGIDFDLSRAYNDGRRGRGARETQWRPFDDHRPDLPPKSPEPQDPPALEGHRGKANAPM